MRREALAVPLGVLLGAVVLVLGVPRPALASVTLQLRNGSLSFSGALHGGGGGFLDHPETWFIAIIIAAVVFGLGAVVLFLIRKFIFPVEKKW